MGDGRQPEVKGKVEKVDETKVVAKVDLPPEAHLPGHPGKSTDQSTEKFGDVAFTDPHAFGKKAEATRTELASGFGLTGKFDNSPDATQQRQLQLAQVQDATAAVLNATSPDQLRGAQQLMLGLDRSLPAAQAALAQAHNRLAELRGQLEPNRTV
jgi:hypothetical protein